MSRAEIQVLRRNLRTALRSRRLEDAETVLARLKREDPLSVQTRGSELELLVQRRRIDEARVLAGQLIEAFPGSARVHYLAGQAAYYDKDYSTAASCLEESQRLAPSWRNRYWLGRCLTQSGRFEQAEALLVEVAAEQPFAARDLGWLYERMGEPERAVESLERYLKHHADDSFVQAQIERLRAKALGAERLGDEIETLRELGEEIPAELVPEYVESLLHTGQGAKARATVLAEEERLEPRILTRTAWICHRLQAHDLALRLLMRTLPWHLNDIKHLTAMEADARRCHREDELAELYRSLVPDNPRLWGRLRRIESRQSSSNRRSE